MGADYENMSSEEAVEQIDATLANPEHLYHSPQGTIGRPAAITHMENLYKVKHGQFFPAEPSPSSLAETPEEFMKATSAENFKPEQVKAMEEALDEKAGRDEAVQEKLREGIRQEVEQVNELMPGSDIDIDEAIEAPTPEKLSSYKMMRLLGQNDFASLTPLIVKDARDLGMPRVEVERLQNFMASATPGAPLASDITNIIIRHIHKAKKERANRGD